MRINLAWVFLIFSIPLTGCSMIKKSTGSPSASSAASSGGGSSNTTGSSGGTTGGTDGNTPGGSGGSTTGSGSGGGSGPVTLQLRAKLEGISVDRARDKGLYDPSNGCQPFPQIQPFDAAPFQYHGSEIVDQPIVDQFYEGRIVDWVLVRLRSVDDPAIVLASRAALLTRENRVVDVDGESPVSFPDLVDGDYFVSLHHQNHLPVQSLLPLTFKAGEALSLDFMEPGNLAGDPRMHFAIDDGNSAMLAGGDVDQDGKISEEGLGDSSRLNAAMNGIGCGYAREDLNSDGITDLFDYSIYDSNRAGGLLSNMKPSMLSLRVGLEGARSSMSGSFDSYKYYNEPSCQQDPFPFLHPVKAWSSYDGDERMSDRVLRDFQGGKFVDWVLVQLHPKDDPSTVVASRVGVLYSNFEVLDPESWNALVFPDLPGGDYLISVRQKSHLEILSKSTVRLKPGDELNYDFTVPENIAGEPRKNYSYDGGIAWMASGDLNQDGVIDDQDRYQEKMDLEAKVCGYRPSDLNLSGFTSMEDLYTMDANSGKIRSY